MSEQVNYKGSSGASLSVIVPNYNHGKFIQACLQSIIEQSITPLEIIVLDDKSTDNSVEVVEAMAKEHPLIRLVQNEKNLGVMPNLNKGISLAKGDYIYIASADDEVFPGVFEKSLPLLYRHPSAALSCGISRWHNVGSGLTWFMGAGLSDTPCFLNPEQLVELGRKGRLLIVSSTVIWRRGPLTEAGCFHPDLRWHADWFACHVPALRYGACYLPEPLSIANILPKSYYTAGVKKPVHRDVLTRILQLLNEPENADVRQKVIDSGILSLFSTPMLRLILSQPQYRSFLSAVYLRRTLWRMSELAGQRILPKWVAGLVLRLLYSQPNTEKK